LHLKLDNKENRKPKSNSLSNTVNASKGVKQSGTNLAGVRLADSSPNQILDEATRLNLYAKAKLKNNLRQVKQQLVRKLTAMKFQDAQKRNKNNTLGTRSSRTDIIELSTLEDDDREISNIYRTIDLQVSRDSKDYDIRIKQDRPPTSIRPATHGNRRPNKEIPFGGIKGILDFEASAIIARKKNDLFGVSVKRGQARIEFKVNFCFSQRLGEKF
jgi:hypothetical protein